MLEEIERIILKHLLTGEKTFAELYEHVQLLKGAIRDINRHFENAMMNLWVNNRIEEVEPKLFVKSRRVL